VLWQKYNTLPFSELLLHAQVITDFIEAHPDRKITKKWLHAKVKDIAQREKGCWVINSQALPHAGMMALHLLSGQSTQVPLL